MARSSQDGIPLRRHRHLPHPLSQKVSGHFHEPPKSGAIGYPRALLGFPLLRFFRLCRDVFRRHRRRFADRIGSRLAIGWTMGTLVSALGCYLSVALDTPTGATIVVTFGGILVLMFFVHLIVHRGRSARELEGAASARRELEAASSSTRET